MTKEEILAGEKRILNSRCSDRKTETNKNDSNENAETDTKSFNTSTETNTETDTETAFTDTEKILIALINDNAFITLDEMASSSGLSKSGVRYALNQLRDRGVVAREGSQKKGRWVVIHG